MEHGVYTIEEIKRRITPVAEKYRLAAVYLFGSYARGEAREDSDVDLVVDTEGAALNFPFAIGALYGDLADALEKELDLVTERSLYQETDRKSSFLFRQNVFAERKVIYGTV